MCTNNCFIIMENIEDINYIRSEKEVYCFERKRPK